MTPRDVVHLATALLLDPDDELFEANPGLIRTLYDPTCGTGGFLTDAMNHVADYGSRFKVPPVLIPYGQELEPETHAVCLTGMLLRTLEYDPGRDLSKNIKLGSTLSNDQFPNDRFHYGLSKSTIWQEVGEGCRRPSMPSTPRRGTSGASVPAYRASTMARCCSCCIWPASWSFPRKAVAVPPSFFLVRRCLTAARLPVNWKIRRWLLEQDLVEAIVAMPTEIFFRTGISSYLWILSNKKPEHRQGKVQLINATGLWTSIKNEGNKRRIISDDQMRQIVDVYASAEDGEISRMLDYRRFAYRRIRVLRPLRMSLHVNAETMVRLMDEKALAKLTPERQAAWKRALKPHMESTHPFAWAKSFAAEVAKKDAAIGKVGKTFIKALINAFGIRDPEGEPVLDADGNVVADTDLTDYENVPFLEDIRDYFAREVLPHVPDAWIDKFYLDKKDKAVGVVGYEINFNRFFFKYEAPPKLEEIDRELKCVEAEIAELLSEVTE